MQYHAAPSVRAQRDRSWISAETWQLVDRRCTLRRQCSPFYSATQERELKDLHNQIRRSLHHDRKARIEKVSQEIESLLVTGHVGEAYRLLRCWYKHSTHPQCPTFQDLDVIHDDYFTLFAAVPSTGDPLPIRVSPFLVPDHVPDSTEISSALNHMRRGRQPGPSGIRVKDLRHWCDQASTAWDTVVTLVQMAFHDGELPTAFCILFLFSSPNPTALAIMALPFWKLSTNCVLPLLTFDYQVLFPSIPVFMDFALNVAHLQPL